MNACGQYLRSSCDGVSGFDVVVAWLARSYIAAMHRQSMPGLAPMLISIEGRVATAIFLRFTRCHADFGSQIRYFLMVTRRVLSSVTVFQSPSSTTMEIRQKRTAWLMRRRLRLP
jgi:hypothetical protein